MTDQQHIELLASRLGASLVYDSPRNPYAQIDRRTVHTHPIETPTAYWSALHELGHIADDPYERGLLSSFDSLFGSTDLVAAEARAWTWALDNSRHPLTDDVRGEIILSLGGYITQITGPSVVKQSEDVRGLVARVSVPASMERAYKWYLDLAPNNMTEDSLRVVTQQWHSAYNIATGNLADAA